MQTKVKTAEEIINIRESGRMLATIHALIKKSVKSGWSGRDVDELCKKELKAFGATAPFLGYNGFPATICISVNDEVVHGIPNDIVFEQGDLVSFDFGVEYNKMITDSAFSMFIGDKAPSKAAERLLKATERACFAGIDVVKNGVHIGDIGAAVQKVLDAEQLGIVQELVGHGTGHHVHEEPDIPNYGMVSKGPTLRTGMTIAIEPMAMLGDRHVIMDSDGWTIRSRDGSLAAHWEHTVLITDDGAEILTLL
jgi:methionyl aminopeptidase